MHRRTHLIFTAALACATASYAVVEVQTDRLRIAGITAVRVEGQCLDVKVTGGDNDTLFMEPVDLSGSTEVRSQKTGTTLRVWVSGPAAPPFACSGRLVVQVPRSAALTIENISGDVKVSGMRTTDLSVVNVSGDIDIKDCAATFAATSASGDIGLANCDGAKALKSASGDVSVGSSRGSVAASTVSGSQSYEKVPGTIDAQSISGSISIDGLEGGIRLKTVSGSIDAEEVRLTANAELHSASGSIAVELTNVMNELIFDLSSGSGSLALGDLRGEKRLVAGSGGIRVISSTVSGSQTYDVRNQ